MLTLFVFCYPWLISFKSDDERAILALVSIPFEVEGGTEQLLFLPLDRRFDLLRSDHQDPGILFTRY